MEAQEFRKDFYYRLCLDIINTPFLHQQIIESPDVLWDLVGYISNEVAAEEGHELAKEAQAWIQARLEQDYAWPGNIRELEQCVCKKIYRCPNSQVKKRNKKQKRGHKKQKA